MDWCVGQIIDHLEDRGLSEDTLIIFSSDNGPVLDDGYHDEAVSRNGDHRMAGPLRGSKYSMYDGGTRADDCGMAWPYCSRHDLRHDDLPNGLDGDVCAAGWNHAPTASSA